MASVVSTASLILLISLFTVGLSIKCFQCNSAEEPKCAGLTVNDTQSKYYQECSQPTNLEYANLKPFCRKLYTEVTNAEHSQRIFRSCGWLQDEGFIDKDICRKENTDFILRTNCQCFSPGCNSSSKIHSMYMFVFSFLSIVFVYKLIC